MQPSPRIKRSISGFPVSQFSNQSIINPKEKRQQFVQSQDLNNSQKTQNQRKLPLLLLKLKLQQFGFRAVQYNQHIQNIDQMTLKDVVPMTLEIVNTILNQPNQQNPSSIMVQRNYSSLMSNQAQINNGDSQIKNCPVCFENFYDNELFQLQCDHIFCKSCLSGHIQNSVYQAKYKIPCMQFQCNKIIGDEIIKLLCEQILFNRYIHFKKKKQLQGNPNNKFCSVPNCEGILQQRRDQYLCPQCKAQYCLDCLRKKHEGDCSEKIQQIIQRSYKDYNIKKCPNCRAPIQKQDGCNHMNCKNCNYEFCWLCLSKYSKYHYRYFNCCGCPGMQFQNEQQRVCQRIKQICVFIILPGFLLLILATVFALLPIYMFSMIFIKSVQKAMEFKCLQNCCQSGCKLFLDCDDDSDCECCTQCCVGNQMNVAHFFVGILLIPYGVLYAMTVAPVKFFIYVYEFILEILD